MSTIITESIQLSVINCGECGGSYAINERYKERKKEVGGFWTCPYCKSGWGYGESDISKIKKELEQTQISLRQAKCATLEADRMRQEVEKKMRRVKNGVCPCCNRSFQNLQRHMKTKHPEAKAA